jgi:glycosyltransferase involved in cell wall biosynthesis
MKCSLIIATYNRGPRIATTIDSVLAQSQMPDEIVIVDDGSTDETADWVMENYPMVRLVRKENGGTSSARNAGAQAAGGDWLIFLDHDDLLLPHAVETLMQLASDYPRAASVHTDHVYDNTETGERLENHHYTLASFKRLLTTPKLEDRSETRLYGYPLYLCLLKGNLLQQPYAIRKTAFETLKGYSEDTRYCEDWDLYLRIAQRYPIAVSDAVTSIHCIEGSNLHLTAAERQEIMYEKVLARRQASHRWWQWRERIIVKRKLAAIYKGQGDREAVAKSMRRAWACYAKSYWQWPLDHVVCARLLLWLPKAIAR